MTHSNSLRVGAAVCCLVFLAGVPYHHGASQNQRASERNQEFGGSDIAAIVEEVARLVAANYVFEDKGKEITEFLLRRLKEGAYGQSKTLDEFSKLVTADLRSVTNDAHLGVVDMRRFGGGGARAEEMQREFNRKRLPFRNYGFLQVDRLPGNIGYIELDEFAHLELEGKNFAGETARAALRLISNCSAVIFDLRDNFGGREEMANLLLSAFFDPPRHILTDKYRGRPDRELWTEESPFSGKLAEVPLYVLVSQHTVSGGEMFAFVLKNQGRAVLVGENTRGAAHKTHLFPIEGFPLNVAIPVGTVVDPDTGIDWEGKGVEPDIALSPGKALDTAHLDALKKALQADPERWKKAEIEWAMPDVEARLNPVVLRHADLVQYTGQYGERRISVEEGNISYQRGEGEAYALQPMCEDLFRFQDPAMFYVRLRFLRDESGNVTAMVLLYDTGQRRECPRTGRFRNISVYTFPENMRQ